MISLGNISGTISVGIDGHDQIAVATFEVPVTTTLDPDTGGAVLTAAPHDAVIAAAAAALKDAAEELLATLPSAEVTTT